MFTGIISNVSNVKNSQQTDDGLRLTFSKPLSWTDLELGESINTNGVCLTVEAIRDKEYDCLLVPETLRKTSFGASIPESVNLERALSLNGRLGGHFVQGHVDETAKVSDIKKSNGYEIFIEFSIESTNLVIPKGSVTVNGVSLTVASVDSNILSIALIPHTLEHTTFGKLISGDQVNLEFDMIGKYVQKIMRSS
jgi:riboflavin synthase